MTRTAIVVAGTTISILVVVASIWQPQNHNEAHHQDVSFHEITLGLKDPKTIYPDLHADGVTPDDAAFTAAINKCNAMGGTLMLPPGTILLVGNGHPMFTNCHIVGTGTGSNQTALLEKAED